VQLAQDRDERVVCRLHGEIVEIARADVRDRAPPSHLDPGGAQQQRMQALDGVVALASRT
jgi:hypothetical protein